MKNIGKSTYVIHLDSFLRLSELVGEYSHKDNVTIELPDVEGLNEAVCLINKLCSQKVWKMREYIKDNFIAKQLQEIRKKENLIHDPTFLKEILEATYQEGVKETAIALGRVDLNGVKDNK